MKYKETEHDRIYYSTKMLPIGARPSIDNNHIKNSADQVQITYETLEDYYDIYVNGLNAVASGTLYLTGDSELLESPESILVDGVDSGETGMQYDFEVISDYCIKVPQFQPVGAGELDFIFVNDGNLYKLSSLYDFGYQKIQIDVADTFGKIPVSAFTAIYASDQYLNDIPLDERDPWNVMDGSTTTAVKFGYNVFSRYLTFVLDHPRTISSIRMLSSSLPNVGWVSLSYKAIDDSNYITGFTSIIADSTVPYSETLFGGEWFTLNFPNAIQGQVFRLEYNGFVSQMIMNEIEFYAAAQTWPSPPLETATVKYAAGSNVYTSSGSNRDPLNVFDGDLGTGMTFGYNVSTRTFYWLYQFEVKIGTIRIYSSSLPNVSYMKVEYTPGDALDTTWVEVANVTYNASIGANQWFEVDLSSQQLTGSRVKLTFPGFVSEMTINEIEVLPW